MSVAVMPATTIIIVLIGVLLNNANMNARFGDLNARFGDMNGRFGDMSGSLAGHIEDIKVLIQAYSDRQDANLRRVEDELLGKLAELDNRLSRIEHHLNLG
jgi:hypothetical protein